MGPGDPHAEIRADPVRRTDNADAAGQRAAQLLIGGQGLGPFGGEAGVALRVAGATDRGGPENGVTGVAAAVRSGGTVRGGVGTRTRSFGSSGRGSSCSGMK